MLRSSIFQDVPFGLGFYLNFCIFFGPLISKKTSLNSLGIILVGNNPWAKLPGFPSGQGKPGKWAILRKSQGIENKKSGNL